jgi:hypothetical protein
VNAYSDGVATIPVRPDPPPAAPSEGLGFGTLAVLIIGGGAAIGAAQGVVGGVRKGRAARRKAAPKLVDRFGRPL